MTYTSLTTAATRIRWASLATPRRLDGLEQVAVVTLNALLCWRMLPGILASEHWFGLLFLLSEGSVLVFTLLRRPTDQISVRPVEWGVAFMGTVGPLLVMDSGAVFLPELGTLLMMAGGVVHIGAKLTLRRSFGIVAAHRGLKSEGIYAIVRHPMYLGYMIVHLGFLLAAPSLWNLGIYCLTWSCFILRMLTEERVLSANAEYQAYCARVRYRLIPGLW